MGVPGTVTLLKKRGTLWRDNIRLKNCKLIVDVTDEMYWFTKRCLSAGADESMDKFGTNMVAFSSFVRGFFDRLLRAQVKPIIVYNGARLSEKQYGSLISKAKFIEKSARIRMLVLSRGRQHTIIPSLATNIIKNIINDLKLESHQSNYEVYPLLIRLAKENDCPVISSHSDLILADLPRGFFWFDDSEFISTLVTDFINGFGEVPRNLDHEIPSAKLYIHRLMTARLRLSPYSSAIYILNVLLRPDFSGRYFKALNVMFELPGYLRFQEDRMEFSYGTRQRGQPCYRRLCHILENWPKALTDLTTIRKIFHKQVNGNPEAMNDYDGLFLSFSQDDDLQVYSLVTNNTYLNDIVQEALTKRESSASYLLDVLMAQTNIDRGTMEDFSLFRSCYSLKDPSKIHLINKIQLDADLKIIDRRSSEINQRFLKRTNTDDREIALDEIIHKKFLFPDNVSSLVKLREFINESKKKNNPLNLMKISLAFKDPSLCEQLLVLLLIARYTFLVGFRDNYDIPPSAKEVKRDKTVARPRDEESTANSRSHTVYFYNHMRHHYYEAIYNSFIYYAHKKGLVFDRMEEHELLQSDHGGFFADTNLASQDISSSKVTSQPGLGNINYIKLKHLNEMLNSSLKAYVELNSLYNYPSVRLQLDQFYDCKQIFKICSYLILDRKDSFLHKIDCDNTLYHLLYNDY